MKSLFAVCWIEEFIGSSFVEHFPTTRKSFMFDPHDLLESIIRTWILWFKFIALIIFRNRADGGRRRLNKALSRLTATSLPSLDQKNVKFLFLSYQPGSGVTPIVQSNLIEQKRKILSILFHESSDLFCLLRQIWRRLLKIFASLPTAPKDYQSWLTSMCMKMLHSWAHPWILHGLPRTSLSNHVIVMNSLLRLEVSWRFIKLFN